MLDTEASQMIVMHDTGNDGFKLGNFVSRLLTCDFRFKYSAGRRHIPFLVGTRFTSFSGVQYFLISTEGLSLLTVRKILPLMWQWKSSFLLIAVSTMSVASARLLNSSTFKMIPFLVVNLDLSVCLNSRMWILGSPMFYAHTSMYL